MNTTNNPTTTEISMNDSTMPYFWTMCHVKSYCWNRGSHFFSPDTMRFFSSRIQTTPPYKGRVFVTSEKYDWKAPRYYTVRCIRPDGGIDTIGEFQGFDTRQSAHRYAEKRKRRGGGKKEGVYKEKKKKEGEGGLKFYSFEGKGERKKKRRKGGRGGRKKRKKKNKKK